MHKIRTNMYSGETDQRVEPIKKLEMDDTQCAASSWFAPPGNCTLLVTHEAPSLNLLQYLLSYRVVVYGMLLLMFLRHRRTKSILALKSAFTF